MFTKRSETGRHSPLVVGVERQNEMSCDEERMFIVGDMIFVADPNEPRYTMVSFKSYAKGFQLPASGHALTVSR